MLIAYIEIFGTYQVSLLLSDCYTGKNIYETYMQPLFKRKSEIWTCIPDRDDYKINYEYKLKSTTKNKIRFDLRGKELQYLLDSINKEIQEFNTNEALNMNVDVYYQNLLYLYVNSYAIKDLAHTTHLKNFAPYVHIINQEIAALSEASIMEQMLITKGFVESSRSVKVDTWKDNHKNKQLVFFQNIKDLRNDRTELTNYLENKFKQLSKFLDLYVHKLLSEGQWELYASNGLQKSSK